MNFANGAKKIFIRLQNKFSIKLNLKPLQRKEKNLMSFYYLVSPVMDTKYFDTTSDLIDHPVPVRSASGWQQK